MANKLYDVPGVSVGLVQILEHDDSGKFVLLSIACKEHEIALDPARARLLARQLEEMADTVDNIDRVIGSVK